MAIGASPSDTGVSITPEGQRFKKLSFVIGPEMQALARAIAVAAALQLLLLPHVSATQLTAARVTIDPRDLLLNTAGVKLTLAFTPATTLPSGGTITMQYSSGFYATSVTPTMASCSVPLLSTTFAATDSNNRITITTSGANIVSGSSFTITIGGLAVGSAPTSSSFYVSTSADSGIWAGAPGQNSDSYASGTRATQFSMAIADAERIFSSAATLTISFTPSTAISTSGSITLFFPAGMFKNAVCSYSCTFTFKSSLSNAFLSPTSGTTGKIVISNGAQSTSPTGATIPANSPFTITISGLILGPPKGSIPNSVYVSTNADTVPSDAVASGSISIGSYINGSCPYGMSWSNAAQACASCSSALTLQGGLYSASATGLICEDFSDCLSCTACPYAQGIANQAYSLNMLGPSSTVVFYACSNSSSLCPAGSGKQSGETGGCSPCPYDMYNDGSSDRCQYCPSGTYPFYSMIKAPVQIICNGCYLGAGAASATGSVQTGFVMKRAATSCSPRCPAGTGVLSDLTYQNNNGKIQQQAFSSILWSSGNGLKFLWGSYQTSSSSSGSQAPAAPQKDKGCFPCKNWFISKDNTCQACNAGASDRASLNTMGNTFAFASRCVPDFCPWPYVAPGTLRMNDFFTNTNTEYAFDQPLSPSSLAALCNENIHFGGTAATIAGIAVVLFGTYAVAISFAALGQDEALTATRRRKLLLGMLMTTVSPAVDFVSDLMYIVSTLFYSNIVCIVCCFFYLLPMFFFWRMLVKHGVHFGFYVGKPPAFAVMEKYDNIPKALLGLAGYLPLYIINLPVSLPLFLVGHVLYCCKVFPISRVSNLWLRLYTRSSKHTSSVVIIIPLLQESIFEEMLTESVPQMVIQIVNNSYTNVWSPLSYFSTAMSGVMILNGIWRLVYYRLYLKIRIDAIPTNLSDDLFNFASIEQGESPLGRALDAKVAPELELSTIVSAMAESDEFSPLIQRHVTASAAELRAEAAAQKAEAEAQMQLLRSELKSDFQEINQRSLRMEAQLQELISRVGST